MDFEYTVIRSSRKTIAMQLTRDGKIIVRAPKRCPNDYIEGFVKKHENWAVKSLARFGQYAENHPEPDAEQMAVFVEKAKALLPERVRYYAGIMGVQPTGLRITGAKSRFGSCSYKNSLCFSWRLMQFPDEAIDYVVVHELAHIVHKNHGAEFYALIASVMPDYKRRWAMLKS